MNHEKLIDAFIGIDGPMMVMDTYGLVTGNDPVTEDGQQTDAFIRWWMHEVELASVCGITDPSSVVDRIKTRTRHERIENILNILYEQLIDLLDEDDIKYDASSGDAVVFYNDEKLKKTFAIHINQTECLEYEGE